MHHAYQHVADSRHRRRSGGHGSGRRRQVGADRQGRAPDVAALGIAHVSARREREAVAVIDAGVLRRVGGWIG